MSKATGEPTFGTEARALLDALEALGSSLDLNRTADNVLEGLKPLVACERASLFVRDRDGSGTIVCRRTCERAGGAREAAKPDLGQGLVAETLRSGRAALSPNTEDTDTDTDTASSMVTPGCFRHQVLVR